MFAMSSTANDGRANSPIEVPEDIFGSPPCSASNAVSDPARIPDHAPIAPGVIAGAEARARQ